MRVILNISSLATVVLYVLLNIEDLSKCERFLAGPLNPYVFFTDEVRLSLEKASERVLKGEYSAAEAKELLEKYDVRECVVSDGVVRWRIPYVYIPALSVDYVYSPNRPFPKGDWPGKDRCRPLGNNWYWWRIR